MRILRALVGDDHDANELALLAMKVAKQRVVIKRPKYTTLDPLATTSYRDPYIRWEVFNVNVAQLPPSSDTATGATTHSGVDALSAGEIDTTVSASMHV